MNWIRPASSCACRTTAVPNGLPCWSPLRSSRHARLVPVMEPSWSRLHKCRDRTGKYRLRFHCTGAFPRLQHRYFVASLPQSPIPPAAVRPSCHTHRLGDGGRRHIQRPRQVGTAGQRITLRSVATNVFSNVVAPKHVRRRSRLDSIKHHIPSVRSHAIYLRARPPISRLQCRVIQLPKR